MKRDEMKAKECIDCKHHSLTGEYSEKLICAKGHNPRFYGPSKNSAPYCSDYGWKRRCEDFIKPCYKKGRETMNRKSLQALLDNMPEDKIMKGLKYLRSGIFKNSDTVNILLDELIKLREEE